LRYRGEREFWGTDDDLPEDRVRDLWMFPGGCREWPWLTEACAGLRHIFRNWTLWDAGHIWKGIQWWTLSRRTVEAILDYIWTHPLFVLRMSFMRIGDESWTQTLMERITPNVTRSCSLRWVQWRAGRPDVVNRHRIREARTKFALFIRKMPTRDPGIVAFLEEAVLQEGSSFPKHLQDGRC
jgi:hypothetical protein